MWNKLQLIEKEGGVQGIAEYIVDGVIALRYVTTGPDAGRNLVVHKMRGTNIKEGIHPIRFVPGQGIEVLEA